MMNLREFEQSALAGNGVQNDADNVWVVEGKQYTIDINEVLHREKEEPFEASCALEDDLDHEAWEDLYDQYCEDNNHIISAIYWSGLEMTAILMMQRQKTTQILSMTPSCQVWIRMN